MNSITQDMKYRQSLLTYARKYGVSRASRKYNKSRSYLPHSCFPQRQHRRCAYAASASPLSNTAPIHRLGFPALRRNQLAQHILHGMLGNRFAAFRIAPQVLLPASLQIHNPPPRHSLQSGRSARRAWLPSGWWHSRQTAAWLSGAFLPAPLPPVRQSLVSPQAIRPSPFAGHPG